MTLNQAQFKQDCEPMLDEHGLTLPAYFYHDAKILTLEKKQLIENSWQYVGHVSQLKKPGDHIVAEINHKPIIVVLNRDKKIKGFMNVCRHRGGPLAYCNGHSNMLTCKYHGWTYTLDGQLKAAPEMASTPNFSVKDYQLPKVTISTWHGLIFASVANKELESINELLAGIAENIRPIDLKNMQFSHRDEYIIDCNWKVYMDNYLEGYHIPHIHPELNKILDYRSYETHCFEHYSYQFSPLETTADSNNVYGNGKAHYYTLFPNMMLNIMPRRLQTNLVIPIDTKTCKVVFDYFYVDIHSEATQKMMSEDKAFSDEVQKEDILICEQVQKGLDSGSYEQGRLCMQRETGVLHFQNLLRKALRTAINPH